MSRGLDHKLKSLGDDKKKMKKTKLMGVAAIAMAMAMALIIAFSRATVASQPVCNTNSAVDQNDISAELKAYLDYWGVDASEVNLEMFRSSGS